MTRQCACAINKHVTVQWRGSYELQVLYLAHNALHMPYHSRTATALALHTVLLLAVISFSWTLTYFGTVSYQYVFCIMR
jgi:hypothetical protein